MCIGLGLIGEPMAERLLQHGHEVVVVGHRRREPIERLVALGAVEARSPAKGASVSDVALLGLPTSAEVESVLFGVHGIATEPLSPGYTILDAGTCYPPDTRRIAKHVAEKGGRFLDAPVSGGVAGARAGTLAVMVGGDAATLADIRPVLEAIGGHIFHFGGVGAGHTAKLIQNLIGWIEVAGIAEGLALAKSTGLDLPTLFKMLSVSHSNSPILQWMVPKVFGGKFDDVEARLDIAYKDVRQAAELARASTVLPLGVANATTELFQLARALGFGGQDSTAVVRGLEIAIGEEIRCGLSTQ